MSYHSHFIALIKTQPLTLGTRLGRWAIHHNISAAKIARASGATRQTVYNWMKGGEVFVAYRPAVTRIVECLQSSKTTKEAWGKLCQEFHISN